MQTTRIDTINLGSEAIDILKRAFLYDDATLAEGTAEDIAGLPSGLKIQLRKLFPNLSTVTVAAPAPVVTAKPNSLLENLDDRPQAIELVLKRIASGDKSPDLRRVARKLGIESVARLDGKVSIETTISYLSHLDDGGSRRSAWKDHEIVSLDDLSAKLRISPISSRELEDGVDPRTGIDWSAQSDDVIVMIRYAAKDDMLAGMSEAAVVAAYNGGDPDLVKRTQRRMKTSKADAEGLLRELRSQHPARVLRGAAQASSSNVYRDSAPAPAAPIQHRAPQQDPVIVLSALLAGMFSGDEAVRFAPSVGVAKNSLPGPTSSPASIYHSLAENMQKNGSITVDSRNAMIAERPRREADIRRAFAQCGIY